MSRPRCRHFVESEPTIRVFKPAGVPLRDLAEVLLPVEGIEAIRLKDLEGCENVEAARRMGVSRATFERVLESARRGVAEALVVGRALRISGGSYEIGPAGCHCPSRVHHGTASDGALCGCPRCAAAVSPGAAGDPEGFTTAPGEDGA